MFSSDATFRSVGDVNNVYVSKKKEVWRQKLNEIGKFST
jgi:hypothetical protein